MPDREVDVAIVGGGITGAAAARDAALRGLSTALFEKGDFSSGTTAGTSRLIHGGLRYLERLRFGLVRECLAERDWVFSRLPHLLSAIPILIPAYRGDRRGPATLRAGMTLYDLLARGRATPGSGTVGAEEAIRRVPGIRREGLLGGAVFHDCQLRVPERLVVENLLAATAAGAALRNYAEVESFAFDGTLWRLVVRDRETGTAGQLSARVVLNATGPWADRTRRLAGFREPVLSPTKGAHIVLPAPASHAMFAAAPGDGRLVFLLPLDGRLLVGTTETPFDADPGTAGVAPEDVSYLMDGVRRVLPGAAVADAAPLYGYAGVRPLLKEGGPAGSRTSREHRVFREGPGGRFVTIAGGKMTTFRRMAEDAVTAACAALGRPRRCTTLETPFPGEIGGGPEGAAAFAAELSERFLAPVPLARHLVSLYGRRAARVLEIAGDDPGMLRPLSPLSPDIAAQAILAAREEWGRSAEDVVLRRLHVGIAAGRGREAIPVVETLLGRAGAASSPRRGA